MRESYHRERYTVQDNDAGKRYGVRRDDVQADAAAHRDAYLARQRGEAPTALPTRLPVGTKTPRPDR